MLSDLQNIVKRYITSTIRDSGDRLEKIIKEIITWKIFKCNENVNSLSWTSTNPKEFEHIMKLLETSDKKENLKISHNKKFCYRHKTNSELQLTSHQKRYTRQERNDMFKVLKEKKIF